MTSGIFSPLTGFHNRRSIRLRGYDYSRRGAYFVTVCIHDRTQRLFGDVVDGRMVLNDAGKFAQRCWTDIPRHFPGGDGDLDEFVVMPNHVHGIIMIRESVVESPNVGVQNFEPLRGGSKKKGPHVRTLYRFRQR
jgi:putative transposase